MARTRAGVAPAARAEDDAAAGLDARGVSAVLRGCLLATFFDAAFFALAFFIFVFILVEDYTTRPDRLYCHAQGGPARHSTRRSRAFHSREIPSSCGTRCPDGCTGFFLRARSPRMFCRAAEKRKWDRSRSHRPPRARRAAGRRPARIRWRAPPRGGRGR